MTNTKKITVILIIGGWIIIPTLLFILDRFLSDKEIPARLYILLFIFISILYWLIRGIRHYQRRIEFLHAEIEITKQGIREISDNIRIHSESIVQGHISQETVTYHLFRSFKQKNPAFIEQLRETIPGITEGEEKLCILILQNKKNKEIAEILAIDEKSIYTSRSRLKHKLTLGEGETMDQWIRSIGKTTPPAGKSMAKTLTTAPPAGNGSAEAPEPPPPTGEDILKTQEEVFRPAETSRRSQ